MVLVALTLIAGGLIMGVVFLWAGLREYLRERDAGRARSARRIISVDELKPTASTLSSHSLEESAFVFYAKRRLLDARLEHRTVSMDALKADWRKMDPPLAEEYQQLARMEAQVLHDIEAALDAPEPPPLSDVKSEVLRRSMCVKDIEHEIRTMAVPGSVPDSRNVAKLVDANRAELDELRRLLGDDAAECDDLFLLRYILSKGSAAKSVAAVRFCRVWRSDPANKFHLDVVARGETPGVVKVLTQFGLNVSAMHKTLKDGGPIVITRLGVIDVSALMDVFTQDELLVYLDCVKEQAFLMCDSATRKSGTLVKMIIVNDMTGVRLKKPPTKWLQSFGESTKLSENLYPQVLASNVMVAYPSWVSLLMSVAKLFLSAKLLSKFRWCKGDMVNGDIASCPYVTANVAVADVPTFLGGDCACAGGCIAGIANNVVAEFRPVTGAEVEAVRTAMVSVRESEALARQRYAAGTPIELCFGAMPPHVDLRFVPFSDADREHAHQKHVSSLMDLHTRFARLPEQLPEHK